MINDIALRRILQCRAAAMDAGLRPTAVECGPDIEMPGGAVSVLGLRIKWRADPGVAVLAMPGRKIGRYEVVCPVRFEEAA